MRVGTKSVLFGAHCWCLHPWFVAWAWWRLYGFPWDPRLWLAFFVHDLGYIGKPNMDGVEGETHPELGARLMAIFDGRWPSRRELARLQLALQPGTPFQEGFAKAFYPASWRASLPHRWSAFTLLHSRYLAKSMGCQPSRLCIADKLAIALTPAWLYLPLVRATGEIHEYRAHAKHRLMGNERVSPAERARILSASERDWYAGVQDYCRRWAEAHRDGAIDTWTSDARQRAVRDAHGVWQ